jgi:hypothetical protein
VAVALSPGAVAAAQAISESEVGAVQNRIRQAIASPDMSGMDTLLLDHVSLSTPQGGSVMDASEAANWLRDHSAPNLKVGQVSRGTQDVMLQVSTYGWPQKDPIQAGQVIFSLRRYDVNGRQDDSGGGEWKIDVIEAD